MSNTRRAIEGSPLRQERFASSPEFERGFMANLVAKRCTVLENREDRQLVWFIQKLSHGDGIKNLAAHLMEKFPERIATASMQEFGTKAGQMYSDGQVKAVRSEIDFGKYEIQVEVDEMGSVDASTLLSESEKNVRKFKRLNRYKSEFYPPKYPASAFVSECSNAAREGLEKHLMQLCLNPALPLNDGSPCYFPTLVSTLREFMTQWIAERQPEVVTSIGEKINDALEYAIARRRLVIMDGTARTGKTHAAKTWCNLNPGSVRFVECPASNDDITFFRAIAISLGVSVNQNAKAHDLRMRIEETLRDGDLSLVIDEAHYLWPQQRYYRASTPTRINWIMKALVNQGVAVALITTPQFFRSLSALEQLTCWTSDQFKGRIGRYVKLPDILSRTELEDVAGVLLPGVRPDAIRALACYAESSGKYLGALDAVADTAKYLCEMDGRQKVEFKDVECAIRESVTPSDEALKAAFASATEPKRRRVSKVFGGPMQQPLERDATQLPRQQFTGRATAPAREIAPREIEMTAG